MTLVSLFSAGAAAERAVGPFTRFLQAKFASTAPFIAENSSSIAFVTIILGVGLLTLVIGEITPKSIAIRFSEPIALFVSWPIRWMQMIAAPIIALVTVLSNLMVKPFGGTATFHPSVMSEEELKLMVEESEEHGVIETEEKEMIHSIFEFGDTVVRKVMTPRPDITAIEADISVDDMIRKVTESGHSRLPVYDDDLDNIVGIVHVKDVLAAVTGDSPPAGIRQLMRQAYFIPENKLVGDLLAEMRRNRIQLAVVRNPDDGTVTGLVSIEDLLEEIVGEIEDEYDEEVEPDVTHVDERTTIVDGRMPLEDFNERMGVEIPVEDSDTIGGFVFGLLGHQPETGETTQWDGLDLRVEVTDGKRIQKVCVIRTVDAGPAIMGEPPGANGAGRNGSRTPNPEEASQPSRAASMD
jgi:putative hemolysin